MLNDRRRELLVIGGLIAGTLGFAFGLLPAGISEGYGSQGPGLSPRSMPQLLVAGVALALIYGLFQSILAKGPIDETPADQDRKGAHPLRAVGAVLICLLFAYVGFDAIGFYVGGITMAALLTWLLGERKVLYVLFLPILTLVIIYGIFELGFQIKLPKADLIPGMPI